MATTDRRTPWVYIDVEDKSYVAESIEVGRAVYIAGMCQKGRHNQVVTLTSADGYFEEFGTPHFNTTTQSCYNMANALTLTNKAYFVRVMPFDSKVSNVVIKRQETIDPITCSFTFSEAPTDVVSRPFPEDYAAGELDSQYIADKNAYDTYISALEDSKTATTSNQSDLDLVSVGDWIYAGDDEVENAVQVVSKSWSDVDSVGTIYLSNGYVGSTVDWVTKDVSTIYKYSSHTVEPDPLNFGWDVNNLNVDLDPTALYAFYAVGAGDYYDRYFIRGTRNTEYEALEVDKKTGDPLYKYLFMDIAVYEKQDDGSTKLVEGPWTVSLANRYSNGTVIRDRMKAWEHMFIEDKINNNSKLIRCKSNSDEVEELIRPDGELNESLAERRRLEAMLLFSAGNLVGTNYVPSLQTPITLGAGDNGHVDYDQGSGVDPSIPMYIRGKLQTAPQIEALIAQAFAGIMDSVDGSISKMRDHIYPTFQPDYVVTGGFPAFVQEAGRDLCANRGDCFHIADTGYRTSYESDLNARRNFYDWNDYTSMLYIQYREIRDPWTGEKIKMNPCYHAIERHLYVDGAYFLSEPVANIEKGAIPDAIDLVYEPNHTERGDLREANLNYTISEPDGKYFLEQFTTWKQLSILKRAHAAKFVCYCRKMIPGLLKSLLQRKGTPFWVNQAQQRVEYFISKFTDESMGRYHSLSKAEVSVSFDERSSELNVLLKITPLRAIERINVHIVVE
jgi:hypothetical protein